MKTKRISLTQTEWKMIAIALADGMRARQELARDCKTAAESGVQTPANVAKWVEFSNRAEREMQEFKELQGKILSKMYK